MSEQVRGYIYRIGLSVVLLAAAYGVISGEQEIAAWTALVTAIAGNGLAVANTSVDK